LTFSGFNVTLLAVREGYKLTEATSEGGERDDLYSGTTQFKTMTEEQRKEEQRKRKNSLKRWNESVQKVRELQREWQKENEKKFGPFLKKF